MTSHYELFESANRTGRGNRQVGELRLLNRAITRPRHLGPSMVVGGLYFATAISRKAKSGRELTGGLFEYL